MNRRLLVFALMTLLFLGLTTVAYGQATRTWVSGVGDDVNPCSRTAPCKTFAGAISKTAKDGEISVLDPGGFGTVTITKSLTINGTHGQGYGSILAALAPSGVLINITDVNDVRKTVRLNSLYINGASTGTHGVRVLAATNVHINDSIIDGFTGNGIDTTTLATTSNIYVNDTQIRKCAIGMNLRTANGFFAVGVLNNVKFEAMSSHGMEVGSNGFGTVKNSNSSRHAGAGFSATGTGSLTVIDSVIAHNATGVSTAAGSTARVISNELVSNTTTFVLGGTVSSDLQNRIVPSGALGAGPNGPAIALQ